MIRERALKVVLFVVGLLFLIGVYGLIQPVPPADQMLGSVYATLGVFLLLAARKPSANQSLIAFAAWSSFVHGAVMAVEAIENLIPRSDLLVAVVPLFVIGVALLALAPAKVAAAATQTERSGGHSDVGF
jgi:hypothetical protein